MHSVLQLKPEYERVLYRCIVDGKFIFKKFHLSGILLFKKTGEGQTRIVFQNEMGLSFFDFSWNDKDSFSVNQIIPQLDRTAVINLLQKDFEMLLMKRLEAKTETVFTGGHAQYHRFTLQKGYMYYNVKKDRVSGIDNVGKSKVITMALSGNDTPKSMPDHVFVKHYKAHFTIDLQKVKQDADD